MTPIISIEVPSENYITATLHFKAEQAEAERISYEKRKAEEKAKAIKAIGSYVKEYLENPAHIYSHIYINLPYKELPFNSGIFEESAKLVAEAYNKLPYIQYCEYRHHSFGTVNQGYLIIQFKTKEEG